MSDAAAQIDAIIANATNTGKTASSDALDYAQQAAYFGGGFNNAPTVGFGYEHVNPRPQLPAGMDSIKEIQDGFDKAFKMFDDTFKGNIAYVLDNFFPSINACLTTNSDAWICDTIANGGTGLPPVVEQALYTRGKERLAEEAYRAESEAMTLFARRGFSLPPGVLFAKVNEVQQAALDKSGDLARDVLVENTKIKVETTKFAVEQAIKLRLGVFDALARFLEAAARVPTGAVEYARAFIDARRGVAEAVVGYYNALIKEQELDLTAAMETGKTNTSNWVQSGGVAATFAGHRASAIVGAAQAVGALANAAMSSQNTVVNLGHTVSESV